MKSLYHFFKKMHEGFSIVILMNAVAGYALALDMTAREIQSSAKVGHYSHVFLH